MRQPDPLQRRRDPPLAVGRADAAIDQRDLDILLDRQLVDQIEALEHEADMGTAQQRQLAFRGAGDLLAEKEELTVARPVEQAQNVQQGRLAAARRAHDGEELALPDVQADPTQRQGLDVAGAIGLGEVDEFEHDCGHSCLKRKGRVGRYDRDRCNPR